MLAATYAARVAAVLCLLWATLSGCGGGDGPADALAGVASCDDAEASLHAVIASEREPLLSCATASDCGGVWMRIERGDVRCLDHGCQWPVTAASVGAFSAFLATDPAITALCGYLHDEACQRVVADCFRSEPVCESGRCVMRRVEIS